MSGADAPSFSKGTKLQNTIDRVLVSGGRRDLWMPLRFAIVGTLASITYLAVSLGLSGSHVRFAPWAASLGGFAASFLVSYFGHVSFTYRSKSDHLSHGPRFVLGTLVLCFSFSALSQVLDVYCRLGHVWINLLVMVLFPPTSFLLHTCWSFAGRTSNRS